jgi:hypothetical protein
MRSVSCVFVALCLSLVITGCSLSPTRVPSESSGLSIAGRVHGGQQPISGAHVYLFAAGTGGYGGNGLVASSSNASVSLLTVGTGRTLDTGGGATNGDYYVTTDANGNFSISGDYSCTSGQQVYLYAQGGNPGLAAGTNNTAAGLLAALGACPSAGNFAAATPYVVVNEVSTVAAAYAFAGFATDAAHVSSSGTALAQVGIANAFLNAGNLETLSTGVALAATPAGNGTVPQATINTLANILAACVNSTGAVAGPTNATACYTLLNNSTADGTTTGAVPGDTATAAINIAHNQASNVANLFALASATPPFAGLGTQPSNFSIVLTFTGGGISGPAAVAVDGLGDIWVADNGAVSELASTGATVSPSGGYTGGGLSDPRGIAIDLSGNVWTANLGNTSVSEISSSGSAISPTGGFTGGGINRAFAIAVDASNNVWVPGNGNVAELSNTGTPLSPAAGYSASVSASAGIAIDGSGDLWLSSLSGSVCELSDPGVGLQRCFSGGGLKGPWGVAIDHAGDVWVANAGTSTIFPGYGISGLTSAGVFSPSDGFYTGGYWPYAVAVDGAGVVWAADSGGSAGTGGYVQTPVAGLTGLGSPGYLYSSALIDAGSVAIDGSGNAWLTCYSPGYVAEVVGVGAPVVTPLVTGVKNNTLGTRP